MKVKILKKNIKEGTGKNGSPYCIKSLYASVATSEDANALALQAIADGVPKEKIQEVIKKNEYEGVTSYCFGLNCSHFTFDRVERYGTLDCEVEFAVNKDGFVNPKIKVVDKALESGKVVKVEQIFGYEASSQQSTEDEVAGWATNAPEPLPTAPPATEWQSKAEPNPVVDHFAAASSSLDPKAINDLPF